MPKSAASPTASVNRSIERRSTPGIDGTALREFMDQAASGLGGILNLVIRTFGIKGVLVLAVVGFVGWQMGLIDPMALMSTHSQRVSSVVESGCASAMTSTMPTTDFSLREW